MTTTLMPTEPSPGPVEAADLATLPIGPLAGGRDLALAEGLRCDLVLRGGDPVLPEAPAYDARRRTPYATAAQLGHRIDDLHLVPAGRSKAVLVLSHGEAAPDEAGRTGLAAHGVSLVTLKRGATPGAWRRVKPTKASLNRRLHGATTFKVSGPAAGDPRLRTTCDPVGTRVKGALGVRSGGVTPWGTALLGECDFPRLFDASGPVDPLVAATLRRYGFAEHGAGWSAVDRRFDLSLEPHEANRFGWVLEIDPSRPLAKPQKLTMLGRLRHVGTGPVVSDDGRLVVHLGDRDRHLYKFVSRDKVNPLDSLRARTHNRHLLRAGTLYAAALDSSHEQAGGGRWLPLTTEDTSYVPGMSVADVLLDTRLAVGSQAATPLPGLSALRADPETGQVRATLGATTLVLAPEGRSSAPTFGWRRAATPGEHVALDGGGRVWSAAGPSVSRGREAVLCAPGAELGPLTLADEDRSLFVALRHAEHGTRVYVVYRG